MSVRLYVHSSSYLPRELEYLLMTVEWYNCARLRLYWYNGQCNINVLPLHARTCC